MPKFKDQIKNNSPTLILYEVLETVYNTAKPKFGKDTKQTMLDIVSRMLDDFE